MSTVTMNISLTDELKTFVDARIQARGYSSTSEYMSDLVRRDSQAAKDEQAKEARFRRLIQDGLESGPGRPWEEHKAELLGRIENARRAATRKAA
jgi:antitoxin ParD1/3/4